MGQYASVDITVVFETKKSAKEMFKNLEVKFRKFIKKKLFKEGKRGKDLRFDINLTEINVDNEYIYIKLDSGRVQNAQWQVDMLLEMFKKVGGKDLLTFNGEMNTPENVAYYDKGDN